MFYVHTYTHTHTHTNPHAHTYIYTYIHIQISDFGMSRDLEEGHYYVSHGGKVPVKWTAPEVNKPNIYVIAHSRHMCSLEKCIP